MCYGCFLDSRPSYCTKCSSIHPVKSAVRGSGVDKTGPREFAQELKIAADRALPTKDQAYGHIAVLIITWANDEANSEATKERLLRVFGELYSFECESLVIPVARRGAKEGPRDFLQKQLGDFTRRHLRDKPLLIIVYLGYASVRGKRGEKAAHANKGTGLSFGETRAVEWNQKLWLSGPPLTGGRRRALKLAQSPIPWSEVSRHATDYACGRFLHIFDCPWASEVWNSRNEVLAASGFPNEEGTSNPQPYSFTQTLADYLEQLGGQARSVSQIFADLVRTRSENGLERMPLHLLPENTEDPASIVLAPRSSQPKALTLVQRQDALADMVASQQRVLITAKFASDKSTLDLHDWREIILAHLPPELHFIQVESAEYTESEHCVLLTMKLPLELWDCFPWSHHHDEREAAISFKTLLENAQPRAEPPANDNGAPGPRRSARLKRKHPAHDGWEPPRRKKYPWPRCPLHGRVCLGGRKCDRLIMGYGPGRGGFGGFGGRGGMRRRGG
ncbi:hypothetical protein IWZ00DRAFT_559519 [Phyllosticta capitalensis]|uniref:uncharacterized protein n=1 Tax=Phyllosticta capitalensis TaxID=121624 RepID=UPI00312D9F0A